MEVPAQPAPLLFTCLDEALPGGHQVGGQRLGVNGGTRLRARSARTCAVPGVKLRLPPPRRSHQGADMRALGHEAAPAEYLVGQLPVAVLGQH